MFKTGGALDLMISTSGNDKRHPKSGDQRLLMSEINGKLRAVHYEQKSIRQGHASEIASPNRTVKFDYIADVSEHIQWAKGKRRLLITIQMWFLVQKFSCAMVMLTKWQFLWRS